MADYELESRLERLFSQPPRVADADGFARRVEARLDREWTARRLVIGAAGLAGAVFALGQMVGSGAFARFEAVSGPAGRLMSERLSWATAAGIDLGQPLAWSSEALWTVAALGGLAVVLLATRWAEAL